MNTNKHESVDMKKLLDGVVVEWKTLGEVGEYSPTRVDSARLTASTFIGVDNLVANVTIQEVDVTGSAMKAALIASMRLIPCLRIVDI